LVFVSNRFSKKDDQRKSGWDGLPYANIFWVSDTVNLYAADAIAGVAVYQTNTSLKSNDGVADRTGIDNTIINFNRVSDDYSSDIYHLAKFGDDLNTKYNYGPLCFSANGNKVYFTRNSKKPFEGRYNLEICEAAYSRGAWTNIRVMPFVQPAYDFYHPALSKDGQTLFFCSNKPDGYGGSDVYYISVADNAGDIQRTTPINAGETVNTAGDELFPTIIDGELYYSSDGFAGLGGLDLFKTSLDAKGRWKKPKNLGYPLNTSFDDFGLILDQTKTKGYFTSNRLGSNDIFQFTHTPFVMGLSGTVFNDADMHRLDSARILLGMIEGNRVEPVDSIFTDANGKYHFQAKPNRDYRLVAIKEGFLTEEISFPLVAGTRAITELKPLLLAPVNASPALVTKRQQVP
jgi:hypothetical protein